MCEMKKGAMEGSIAPFSRILLARRGVPARHGFSHARVRAASLTCVRAIRQPAWRKEVAANGAAKI